MTFTAITPCPTRFLVITFERFWNVMVNYKTHVWLVDSHSKSNGCHDDIHIFHKKHVLVPRPCFCIQTCVVRNGADSVDLQNFGNRFNFFAA